MKKIFKFLKELDYLLVFLLIVLIIVVFCYAQLKVFHEDYINFCGFSLFHVITGSMAPEINIDDIVIVKVTNDSNDINNNDIITYKYNQDFVTHRVINKKDDSLLTQGDANNSSDTPIEYHNVVGKVIFILKWSIWKKVLFTPQVMFAITIGFIGIWIIFHKRKDTRDRKG